MCDYMLAFGWLAMEGFLSKGDVYFLLNPIMNTIRLHGCNHYKKLIA